MAKVVVLDVDGTLMDTNYLHTEAWARAFEQVGQRTERAKIHKQIGKGSDLLVPEFIEGEEAQDDGQHRASDLRRARQAAAVEPRRVDGDRERSHP